MMTTFVKPKRPVSRVFWHCTASDNPKHDNIATVRAWHIERGWSDVGYNLMGHKNGTGSIGRGLELTPAAQAGHNLGTIAVVLHGLEKSKFTIGQLDWARDLKAQIDRAYDGKVTHHGHCEVAAKSCPVFDYRSVLGIDLKGRPLLVPEVPKFVAGGYAAADSDDFALPGRLLKVSRQYDEAVEDLQRLLVRHGYDVGKVDGWFGQKTETAVKTFQSAHGLIADGKVGALTREALVYDKHLQKAA